MGLLLAVTSAALGSDPVNLRQQVEHAIKLSTDAAIARDLQIVQNVCFDSKNMFLVPIQGTYEAKIAQICTFFECDDPPANTWAVVQLLTAVLWDVLPAYTQYAIGSFLEAAPHEEPPSLLVAAARLPEGPDRFAVISALIMLAQQYRLPGCDLEKLSIFYRTMGAGAPLPDGVDASLPDCLAKAGSGEAVAIAEGGAFWVSLGAVLPAVDLAAKATTVLQQLGQAYDTDAQRTVLGTINFIARGEFNGTAGAFKRRLIGQNEFEQNAIDHARSLFSHVYETRELAEWCLPRIQDAAALGAIIQEIGLMGDDVPTTFFGALQHLDANRTADFPEFDDLLGNSAPPHIHSCFAHAEHIRNQLLIAAGVPMLPVVEQCCSYLYPSTLRALADAGRECTDMTARKLVLQDLIAHLDNGSQSCLVFQVERLYQSLLCASDAAHIALRAGTVQPDRTFTPFSVRAALARLEASLVASDTNAATYPFLRLADLDLSFCYQRLLGSSNSMQVGLHAISAKQQDDDRSFVDILGSVLSQDTSVFGCINSVIRMLEVDPICRHLGRPSDVADADGSVLARLLHILDNPGEVDMRALEEAFGRTYREKSLSNTTIFDIVAYSAAILDAVFPVLSTELLIDYSAYIYRSDVPNNLEALCAQLEDAIATVKDEVPVTDGNNAVTNAVLMIIGQITNQQGDTMWVQTNGLLKALFDAVEARLRVEGDTNATTLDGRLQALAAAYGVDVGAFQAKIERVLSSLQTFQDKHRRFPFVDYMQAFYGTIGGYTGYTKLDDLSSSAEISALAGPQGIMEVCESAFPACGLVPLGCVDDAPTFFTVHGELNRLRQTLDSMPMLNILGSQNDIGTTTAYGLMNTILPELQAVRDRTASQADLQPSLENKQLADDFNELVKRFGVPGSIADIDDLENITVFGLLGAVGDAISKSYLFMGSSTYTGVVGLLGDCHDTNDALLQRSFFSGLKFLHGTLAASDPHLRVAIIEDAIGDASQTQAVLECSLYRTLNSILEKLAADYKAYMFDAKLGDGECSAGSAFSKMLLTLEKSLQKPLYTSSSAWREVALTLGQSAAPRRELFSLLDAILSNFEKQISLARPLHAFFTASQKLQERVYAFMQSMSSEGAVAELETWRSYVKGLLSTGQCAGCEVACTAIGKINQTVSACGAILAALSDAQRWTLLEQANLQDLQEPLIAIAERLADLGSTYAAHEEDYCFFLRDTTSGLGTPQLGALVQSVGNFAAVMQKVWADCGIVLEAPEEHWDPGSNCEHVQPGLEKLGELLTVLSVGLTPPERMQTMPLEMAQLCAAAAQCVAELRTTLTQFARPSSCVGCRVEPLSVVPVQRGLLNVEEGLFGLETYIRNAYYFDIARAVHSIARSIDRNLAYFSYDALEPERLQCMLQRGALGTALAGLCEGLAPLPDALLALRCALPQQPTSDALVGAVNRVGEIVQTLLPSFELMAQCFYPEVVIFPPAEGEMERYLENDLYTFLRRISGGVSQMEQSWVAIQAAAHSLIFAGADQALLGALHQLGDLHECIQLELRRYTPEEVSWNAQGVQAPPLLQALAGVMGAAGAEGPIGRLQSLFYGLQQRFSDLCVTSCLQPMRFLEGQLVHLHHALQQAVGAFDEQQLTAGFFAAWADAAERMAGVFAHADSESCFHLILDQWCVAVAQQLGRVSTVLGAPGGGETHSTIARGATFAEMLSAVCSHFSPLQESLSKLLTPLEYAALCNTDLCVYVHRVRVATQQMANRLAKLWEVWADRSVCLYAVHCFPPETGSVGEQLLRAQDAALERIEQARRETYCAEILVAPAGGVVDAALDLLQGAATWLGRTEDPMQWLEVRADIHSLLKLFGTQLSQTAQFFHTAGPSCIALLEPYLMEQNITLQDLRSFLEPVIGRTGIAAHHEADRDWVAVGAQLNATAREVAELWQAQTLDYTFAQTLESAEVARGIFMVAESLGYVVDQMEAVLLAMAGAAERFPCAPLLMPIAQSVLPVIAPLKALKCAIDAVARRAHAAGKAAYFAVAEQRVQENTTVVLGNGSLCTQAEWFNRAETEVRRQRAAIRFLVEQVAGDRHAGSIEEGGRDREEDFYPARQ